MEQYGQGNSVWSGGREAEQVQIRDVYSLALIQLEQQREETLTGALRRLVTKKSMATYSAATIRAGALPRVLKCSRVVDAGCAQPVKDVIIDLCAG